MKIPQRFKLSGKAWSMDWADLTDEKARGICFAHKKVILIDEKMKGDELLEVVLHELLHACFPIRSSKWNDGHEEAIVTMLAPKLLEALRATGWVKK